MKKFYLFIFAGMLCAFQVKAQCGTNLLNNPDFEAPVQPNLGNNLTGLNTFNGGWNMTGGTFNIIKVNGSSYGGGPDTAASGFQYLDIASSGGTAYQDFNVATAGTVIDFGGYFSSREQYVSYINWTASVQLLSLPSLTVVATSNSRVFTNSDGAFPQQEIWHYLSGNATLPAGNYRFVTYIGDFGNFDNAFAREQCIVPLQLLSFTGTVENNAVKLNWKIASAVNFSHFEIEKSDDGLSFTKLGNMAFQNSDQYQYRDGNLVNNNHYFYRLKMVDFDGNFSYSNVLHFKGKSLAGMAIMGNPVKNTLIVTGLQTSGQIAIYNREGKLLHQKNVNLVKETMDVSALAAGLYILKYHNGQIIETQKFIKE